MTPRAALARGQFRTSVGFVVAVLAATVLAWAIIFSAVPPERQHFPLNDDATYSAGLYRWLDGQGVQYFGWASIPQLGQWVWAAPFVNVLGQTFVATRLSTIVLSLGGILSLFVLFRRESGLPPAEAALGCFLLAFNPLFLMLSGTFMSDVPALSFSLIALAAVSVALERSAGWLLIAVVAALAAVTTRQNGIAVPLVMGYMAWRRPPGVTRTLTMGIAGGVFLISVGIVLWFGSRDDVMRFTPQLPSLDQTVLVIGSAFCYLGLFVIPGAALGVRDLAERSWLRALALAGVIAVGWLGYTRAIQHQPFTSAMFPAVGNMLTRFGTFGTGYMPGERPLVFTTPLRMLLTIAGVVGAGWVMHQAWRRWRESPWPDALTLYGFFQLPFLFVSFTYFDRYLIALLPSVVALALWNLRRPAGTGRWVAASSMVLAMAVFSILITHDWLAWNAARWQLGRQAVSAELTPRDIEGGFEWDNVFALAEGRWVYLPSRPAEGLTLPYSARYFEGMTGRCAISFSPLENTKTIAVASYEAWLGFETREMVLACR